MIYKLIFILFFTSFIFADIDSGSRRNTFSKPLKVSSIYGDEAVNIKAFYPSCKTDTVAAGAVTVNWDDGNVHYIVLPSGATTITLSNPSENGSGSYKIFLKQPSSGAAGTVTFSPVPLYSSGIAYTLTVTNSALDMVALIWEPITEKYLSDVMLDIK